MIEYVMSALNVSVPDSLRFVTFNNAPEHPATPPIAAWTPAAVTQATVTIQVPTRSPPQGATTPHMLGPPTLNPPLLPPLPLPQPEPRSGVPTPAAAASKATREFLMRPRSIEARKMSKAEVKPQAFRRSRCTARYSASPPKFAGAKRAVSRWPLLR